MFTRLIELVLVLIKVRDPLVLYGTSFKVTGLSETAMHFKYANSLSSHFSSF